MDFYQILQKKNHPHTFLTHLSLKAFQFFEFVENWGNIFPGIRNQIKNYGKKRNEVPQKIPENFYGRDDKLYEGSGGESP